jgi:hypothetical protein
VSNRTSPWDRIIDLISSSALLEISLPRKIIFPDDSSHKSFSCAISNHFRLRTFDPTALSLTACAMISSLSLHPNELTSSLDQRAASARHGRLRLYKKFQGPPLPAHDVRRCDVTCFSYLRCAEHDAPQGLDSFKGGGAYES